jgi:D-alanyl-D-alanine carboxypeptidase
MPDWLPHALRYIDQWLDYQMRASEQPGCAIAIAHGQKIVFEQAYGNADLAAGELLTPRHRFRIASHSKSFTAAAIMLLREQNRLRLDDAVGSHVPNLPAPLAIATIGQLLSHSAGVIRDGADCTHWDDLRPFPDEAALRQELSRPLVLDPGERLKYSNIGFGLLGIVINAVTGEPYESWIAREVVAKAGLLETAPDLPAENAEPFASGHTGRLPLGRRVIAGRTPTNALVAATGFVSTAGDLARFYAQLDPAAPHSILSAASRREMTRRHWKSLHSTTDYYYGLGIISGSMADHDYFGHSGGFYGFRSHTSVMPDMNFTVSIILNAVDGPADDWVDGVVHSLDRFAKAGPPKAEVMDWQGRWWNPWGALDLVPLGDTVMVASPESITPFTDATEIAVSAPGIGRIKAASAFGSYGEPVFLMFSADGKPATLSLAGEQYLPETAFVAQNTAVKARPV